MSPYRTLNFLQQNILNNAEVVLNKHAGTTLQAVNLISVITALAFTASNFGCLFTSLICVKWAEGE